MGQKKKLDNSTGLSKSCVQHLHVICSLQSRSSERKQHSIYVRIKRALLLKLLISVIVNTKS